MAASSSKPFPTEECLAAALAYASRGWHVIPLYSVAKGRCRCGKSKCTSPGKHPRTKRGCKDATTDATHIKTWWKRWPISNVGIVTGSCSGIFVLDIDPRHCGLDSLAELEAEFEELPRTVECSTGGGGYHIFFQHPGFHIGNRTNLRQGIDLRGDGGYVVATPSGHVSGDLYRWEEDRSPENVDVAAAPDWLLNLLCSRSQHLKESDEAPADNELIRRAQKYIEAVDGVSEGSRNSTTFRLAGHLASFVGTDGRRLDAQEITNILGDWNRHCKPPLDQEEIVQCVYSAMKNGTPRPDKIAQHAPNATSKHSESSRNVVGLLDYPLYQFFPSQVFPSPISDFVCAAATAIGCDEAYVALPLLASLARAIGNKRVIRLKRTWTELPIIWAGIVGKSGTAKTPALTLSMQFLQRLQDDEFANHHQRLVAYEEEKARYDREYTAWRKSKNSEQPPWKPEEPHCQRYVTSDATIEALAVMLAAQDDGVLVVRDELAGWINGIAEYKGGKGSDLSHWLASWSGQPMTIDRKTGSQKIIHVRQASVSLVGGIQPGILKRAIGLEHLEDGMCARLLLVMPPARPISWNESSVEAELEVSVQRVFETLLTLEPAADTNDCPLPYPIDLSNDARALWIEYFNQHRSEIVDMDDNLAAAASKLEAYTARFALIIQLCKWAAGDASAGAHIDSSTMQSAIELSNWFGHEARRVYYLFAEDDETRDSRELMEIIQRKGGVMSTRNLMRTSRRYPTSEIAEAALNELVQAKLGQWRVSSSSTNQRREFVLSQTPRTLTLTDSPESAEIVESVNVNERSNIRKREIECDLDHLNLLFREAADDAAENEGFYPRAG